MMRMILKVEIRDEKHKLKVLKAIAIPGIVGSNIDMKEQKLTVFGDVDPGKVWRTLKWVCFSAIISVEMDFEEREQADEEARVKEQEEKIRDEVMQEKYGMVGGMNYYHRHQIPSSDYVQHFRYPYPEPVVIVDDSPGCVVM